MLKVSTLLGVAMALFFAASSVQAQQAMEIVVPIGKSPGVSKSHSIIGKIETVGDQRESFTITDPSGTYTVTINDDSKIWLDNSKLRKANETGSPADFKPGRTAEVKYTETKRTSSVTAEWIKVEIAE
jgi:hypothetical protein